MWQDNRDLVIRIKNRISSELEGSLWCSKDLAIGHYPEPDDPFYNLLPSFYKIYFNIIFLSIPVFAKQSLSLIFSYQSFVYIYMVPCSISVQKMVILSSLTKFVTCLAYVWDVLYLSVDISYPYQQFWCSSTTRYRQIPGQFFEVHYNHFVCKLFGLLQTSHSALNNHCNWNSVIK